MLEVSNFIGYPKKSRNSLYTITDSQEKYVKNLESLGSSWEYASLSVSYIRNSFGHRSKEYSELNLENYILCTGCSMVEGIGLPVSKRYSDVLSSMLGCDMYNLGLSGSGNDVIFYNLMSWFSYVPQKPKLVIIGWTGENRFFTIPSGKHIKIHCPSEDSQEEFIVSGDKLKYFTSKSDWIKNITRKIINVPIIEIPWVNDTTTILGEPEHVITIPPCSNDDKARDLVHPGINTNAHIASTIFEYIRSKNLI